MPVLRPRLFPPEALQDRTTHAWARFSFRPDRYQKGAPWCLWTPCSGHGLTWTRGDDLHASRSRPATLCAGLERWRACALQAEAEAARLRDLVACQA